MSKSTPAKKRAAKKSTPKKGAKKKAAKKENGKVSFEAIKNAFVFEGPDIRALNGTPISGVGAVFNPRTNTGAVRVLFQGPPPVDFNNLTAGSFAALVALLSLPNISFNGQYLAGSK